MADLAEGFSPKQFQLAIAAEADGIGGGEATDGDYKFINIDSIEMPSLNPLQVLDVRHGAGRTLKAVDMFLSNKLTVKEISFSGIADATILPMLLSNIMQDASSAYEIAYNYAGTDLSYGDSGSTNAVTTIAGLSDPVLKSFSLTIENDVAFSGYDVNGNYQQMHRAIPEVAVTFDAVVKYDADTDNLIQTFGEQSTSTIANTLTAADSVTRNVDISLPTCIMTDVSFSEEDAMFLSVSSKAVASTSGNIVSITIQ